MSYLFIIFIILSIPGSVWAAPSISDVSGQLTHGSSVTISGSDFGVKNPVAPLWWDDGEGAANGQTVLRTGEATHVTSFLTGTNKHYNDIWPRDLVGDDSVDNMTYRDVDYKSTAGPHSRSQRFMVGCHNDFGQCLGGEPAQTVALNVADIANKIPKDDWYVSYYYRMASDWPDWAVGNNYKEVNWETTGPNYRIYDNMGNYDAVSACSGGTGDLRRSPPCKASWIAVDNINILATLDGGTYTGSDNSLTLTDPTKNWPANYWVGAYIWNRSDTPGSKCMVVANNATTVTCTLDGGTDNDWDSGDSYAFSASGTSMPGPTGSSWSNCLTLQYQGGPVVTYDPGVKNPIDQWVHYERMESFSDSTYKKLSDNVVELDTSLKPGCHLDLYNSHVAAITIGGYYGKDTCASCNGTIVHEITTSNFSSTCVSLFDPWQPNHNYAIGDKVRASVASNYVYRVTADAGSSGESEPSWPTSGTVVDSGLTWTTEGVANYLQTGLDDRACRYFDDLYVDNTYSRVILADNQDYELASIIEPQVPTTWVDGSITVTMNLGKLPDSGMAYLFVFDSSNNHNSEGVPILLGGDLVSPTAPTNLRVD